MELKTFAHDIDTPSLPVVSRNFCLSRGNIPPYMFPCFVMSDFVLGWNRFIRLLVILKNKYFPCLFQLEVEYLYWHYITCTSRLGDVSLYMEYPYIDFHPKFTATPCRLTPADTTRRINVGLTLVHRLRRWTNVKPTLIQRVVSSRTTLVLRGLIRGDHGD